MTFKTTHDIIAVQLQKGRNLITEKEYRYWLCNLPEFGARKIAELLRRFGSAEAVWKSSAHAVVQVMEEGNEEHRLFGARDAERMQEGKTLLEQSVESYHKLEKQGIRFITPEDSTYPNRLKSLYDMPQGLYVAGKAPEEERPAVAIVGARNCSHYGAEMAFTLGYELGRRGVNVISGMALGIDGEAHRGALAAGKRISDRVHKGRQDEEGHTYAVLGCGVDICYPRTNSDIYHQMSGIISEFSPGTQPFPSNFPMRNRIISGLSDMVIVVEARFRSGSLITADQALEQGRDVYAVPGRITDTLSRGCNELIHQGAGIITDPLEFVENFFPEQDKIVPKSKKNKIALALSEEKVYSCLDFNPTHLGTIAGQTGFSTQDTVSILMKLMMKNLVTETSKNYYALKFR